MKILYLIKSIFFIFGLFFHCYLFGQKITPATTVNLNSMSSTDWDNAFDGNRPLVIQKEKKINGSPFYHDQYLSGSVYLSDSIHTPDSFLFKLNIYTNEIWHKNKNGSEVILTNPRINALYLIKDGKKHLFKKIGTPLSGNTSAERKFLEVFYCGSIVLIKETKKKFTAANSEFTGIGMPSNDIDAYESIDAYFIADEKGILQRVKLKLADLLDMFPSKVKKYKLDIEKYCDTKSLNKNLTEVQTVDLLAFLSLLSTK